MTSKAIMDAPLYYVRLEGRIVTEMPVCIVSPNADLVPVLGDDGRPVGKAPDIVSLSKHYGSEERRVPVIPASTLRGKLRHAAVRVVMGHLPEKPHFDDYVGAALGGVKGSDDEDSYSVVSRDERRLPNPLLGLFGGASPAWDPSRAHVTPAIPVNPVRPMLVSGVRTDVFAREPELVSMLDDTAVADYLGRRADTRAKVAAEGELAKAVSERTKLRKAGDEGGAAAIDSRIDKLRKAAEEAKEEAGNSLLMPHSHFAIPIGTEMAQDITLMRVTAEEFGLLIEALDEVFLNSPAFGGKAGLGYGTLKAEWSVSVRRAGERSASDAGTVSGRPYHGISSPPALEPFRDAWRAFAGSGRLSIAPVRKARPAKADKGAEAPEPAV